MVYVVGLIGFVFGFLAGQMVLLFLLSQRTNVELKTDPRLKIYGLLNWLVAGAGSILFVAIYNQYFS